MSEPETFRGKTVVLACLQGRSLAPFFNDWSTYMCLFDDDEFHIVGMWAAVKITAPSMVQCLLIGFEQGRLNVGLLALWIVMFHQENPATIQRGKQEKSWLSIARIWDTLPSSLLLRPSCVWLVVVLVVVAHAQSRASLTELDWAVRLGRMQTEPRF